MPEPSSTAAQSSTPGKVQVLGSVDVAARETTSTLLRVAVVEDQEDTRLYFEDILQSAVDFRLVGAFANGTDALKGIPSLRPDVVLMDIRMAGVNGIECTKQLKQMLPCLKVIIVTGLLGEHLVRLSSRAGADGYLIKPVTVEQCLAAVRFAAANRTRSGLGKSTAEISSASPLETCLPLSPREHEVLDGLADGLLYKEIADRLGISYSAVHKYQHKIFEKLHVSNRSEAIRAWLDSPSANPVSHPPTN